MVFSDGVEAGAILFSEVGVFGVAASEFVLGEGVGHLGLGGKGAGETIDEAALGGVQFPVGDGFGADFFDFIKDDGGGVGDGAGFGLEAGGEGEGIVNAAGE